MNFWGVEVKGGKPLKVKPPPNAVIHLSQVTLAELKNCPNPVKIYAKHGEQNIVIGMLNADTIPQVSMDLVFEKEIELSHSWKNGAVHLSGYTSFMGEDAGEFSDEDDLMSIEDLQNAAVSLATKAKPVASLAADKKEDKAEDESDDSEEYEDDEDSSDESDSDAEEADGAKSDDLESDSDSEGSDSEEETPVKSAGGKKRSASDTKAPEPKKAKLITPQKSGVEVKGGKPLKVKPPPNAVIHLSQATLAELKNCPNPVNIYAKHGEQNIVIGMLNADTIPQVSMDLVFEKEIELSHSWKNGAVHLSGYTSFMGEDAGEFSDEDDLMPIEDLQNAAVSLATKAKPVASLAADKKGDKAEDESDDSEESEDDDEDSSDESDSDAEADGAKSDDLESDSDSEGSDSEEETPVKSAGGKKRSASDTKAPERKKAKLITPQKSGGKKAGPVHVDTPHPAKTAGKGDKSTVKTTPKSLGQVTCGTCNRSFNSKNGLEAHSKAKHST